MFVRIRFYESDFELVRNNVGDFTGLYSIIVNDIG